MKKLILSFILLFAASSFLQKAAAQEHPWMNYITPSGYFQTGFSTDDSFNNTFYIRRARISIGGTLYKGNAGKFEYKVQAEFANSPKLVDYYFKYTICDEFGIQLGQFKSPLSVENSEYAPLKLEMIDYSLLVQRFVRMSSSDLSGISSTGREMGLQFYGNLFKMNDGHHLFRYNVALFNGNGINKTDDDQRKDFVARLMFFPIKDLSLSGYYLRSLGPDPGIPPQYNDYDYYVFDRYGGGITYDGKYAWFRSEYMAGHTFGWRAHGVYATAGGKINGKIGIGLRYDYFAENSRLPGGFFDHAQQHITAGFSWYVIPRIRLQLNYTLRKEPDLYPTHFVNFMTSISL